MQSPALPGPSTGTPTPIFGLAFPDPSLLSAPMASYGGGGAASDGGGAPAVLAPGLLSLLSWFPLGTAPSQEAGDGDDDDMFYW